MRGTEGLSPEWVDAELTGEQHAGVLTVTWGETEVSRAVRGGGVRAGARAWGPSGWPGEREIAA